MEVYSKENIDKSVEKCINSKERLYDGKNIFNKFKVSTKYQKSIGFILDKIVEKFEDIDKKIEEDAKIIFENNQKELKEKIKKGNKTAIIRQWDKQYTGNEKRYILKEYINIAETNGSSERVIEAKLFEKYRTEGHNILGKSIMYQVQLEREISRARSVDIVFVNEKEKIIYLCELKKNGNNESISRVILEIWTYYKIIKRDEKNFKNACETVGKLMKDNIACKNYEIKMAAIVPKETIPEDKNKLLRLNSKFKDNLIIFEIDKNNIIYRPEFN